MFFSSQYKMISPVDQTKILHSQKTLFNLGIFSLWYCQKFISFYSSHNTERCRSQCEWVKKRFIYGLGDHSCDNTTWGQSPCLLSPKTFPSVIMTEEAFGGLLSHFLPQLPKQVGFCLALVISGEWEGNIK